MRNIWLTADTHVGDREVLHRGPGRPFATIEEHDEALVERWNAVVRPDDVVWHLGDVAASIPAMERFVPRLNGHKILVAGNRDQCWSAHPVQLRRMGLIVKTARYKAAGFERIYDSGVAYGERIAGTLVVLSHLPAHDGTTQQRFAQQRPRPRGIPVVCGDVHHLWRTLDDQVNVGVDVWGYQPVHADEIADLLARATSLAA